MNRHSQQGEATRDPLIAAAPELLDALTTLVNVLDGPTNKRGVLENMPAAIAKARAAIKRAESVERVG